MSGTFDHTSRPRFKLRLDGSIELVATSTASAFRHSLRQRGISVAAWAWQHAVSEKLVHEVLAGRKKGLRGESHKIAVLAGLKTGIVEDAATTARRAA